MVWDAPMHVDILAAVAVTATIQSLFGVGVLLFGTPILLILGYEFVTALAVLLPISLVINLLQVSKHHARIDRQFYRNILFLSVPCIAVCLFLVTRAPVNLGPVVGLFLIAVACKSVSGTINRFVESLVRYERAYFVAMGSLHGVTNLGGSLLTAIVHSRPYEKDVARVTTAVSYGTFALTQLLTLGLSLRQFPVRFSESALYVMAGAGMFLATERLVYAKIGTDKYRTLFAWLLFVSGVVLILKSWLVR